MTRTHVSTVTSPRSRSLRGTPTPTTAGHPALVAAIADEIRAQGPIPFVRFMELALYHPTVGYYTRFDEKRDAEGGTEGRLGEDRIGWAGDYYTNSDVSPVWAHSVLAQVIQMDAYMGHPSPITIVEMGAGKGTFARDLLHQARDRAPHLFERLRYVIVERSPAMQRAQQQALSSWLGDPGRITWLASLGELPTEGVVGVFFSNELIDAFPIHRVRVAQGAPREICVDLVDGRFVERLEPLSTPALAAYLSRLAQFGIVLCEGAVADVNVQAVDWMEEVARVLARGFVITVDYGHLAADLYGPDRRNGTLLCYYHQMASEDPYQRVGLQDMTAHVDFSTLITVGAEHGLALTGFTNQMSFLMGLGVEDVVASFEPGSAEFHSVAQLLRPEGMGKTFKVLIQHKGVEPPTLDGLRYKAFFDAALGPSAMPKSGLARITNTMNGSRAANHDPHP